MSEFESFTWIRTRDGSPTLFHNDEGASFRSQKGAFTESFYVFVKPAIEFVRPISSELTPVPKTISILEFGLGPGTNWLLWTLLSNELNEPRNPPFKYFAIEKDLRSFELGFKYWLENASELSAMIERSTEQKLNLSNEQIKTLLLEAKESITLFPSPEACYKYFSDKANSEKIDSCFFDPFGYDVNPEAYQPQALTKLRTALKDKSKAFSYACNSKFQRALNETHFELDTPSSGSRQLKRERIEFWPKED